MKGQEIVWLLKTLKIETVFPEEGKNRGEGKKEMNEQAQYWGGVTLSQATALPFLG